MFTKKIKILASAVLMTVMTASTLQATASSSEVEQQELVKICITYTYSATNIKTRVLTLPRNRADRIVAYYSRTPAPSSVITATYGSCGRDI